MVKLVLSLFVTTALCYCVEAATVQDLERSIDLNINNLRSGGLRRILKVQEDARLKDDTGIKRGCISREGGIAMLKLIDEFNQVQEQLRTEAKNTSAQDLKALTQQEIDEHVRAKIQGALDGILLSRIDAIQNC